MRTVTINATVILIIEADEGVTISDIMSDIDISLSDERNDAWIDEAIISNYDVTDSR